MSSFLLENHLDADMVSNFSRAAVSRTKTKSSAKGLFWFTSGAATTVMAFQSKKDGLGGPLNKLAVEDATTLVIPLTMAHPLADMSTQAMARQDSQRSKRD
ncbi:hypothetical protein [Limnohabitans sp. Rim8]|uniref:hypothetical protein n=1 Tax=Limnohabitans sp. Rim8 TaxID=1100718 RepID=UPI0025E8BC43|nr:hypothetical protein [Limnohabitans sp. Rim8]